MEETLSRAVEIFPSLLTSQVDRQTSNQQRFLHQRRHSKTSLWEQKRLLRSHPVVPMLSTRRSSLHEGSTIPFWLGSLQECSLPS